jgi:hypothetical protein
MIPATVSRRKDAGKSPYPARKYRRSLEHGSSIPSGKFSDLFRWIPANFLCFPAGTGRKALEKIRKISSRNTASTKTPELPGTGRFQAGLFDLGIHVTEISLAAENLPRWLLEKCFEFYD